MNKPVVSLIAAILVVVIDSFYLNSVKGYFGRQIKAVQGSNLKLDMTATILAYVFIVFGLNYFIISKRASVKDAFLLGLVIYVLRNYVIDHLLCHGLLGILCFYSYRQQKFINKTTCTHMR